MDRPCGGAIGQRLTRNEPLTFTHVDTHTLTHSRYYVNMLCTFEVNLKRPSCFCHKLTDTYPEGGALLNDGGQLREADVHSQVPGLPVERSHTHTNTLDRPFTP